MEKFKYLGYTFTPYGNIIDKDSETRFHRLTWTLDMLNPLLNKDSNYDYYEFYKVAGDNSTDIYFVEGTKMCYVPIRGAMCRIDMVEMRKYIKKIKI